MDLVLALIFAKITAALAYFLTAAIPGLPMEVRFCFCLLGWFVGLVGAFFMFAYDKQSKTPPKPVRHFPKQIAGCKCFACKEHIVMAIDGFECPQCHNIFCHKCSTHEPCGEVVTAEVVSDETTSSQ